MDKQMNRLKPNIYIYSSLIIGMVSQIMFMLFILLGPPGMTDLRLNMHQAAIFNAGLSILFFLQHSILVRRSVRNKLSNIIPELYYSAFYSITSGVALIIMFIFWQMIPYTFAAASSDFLYWAIRVPIIICIAGFYWGVKSLDSFDPFGINKIKRHMYQKEEKLMPMTVRGAYRWMRHPLYFFLIIMIWSYPELTADRLIFNILWTVWMIIGTIMEERDLVSSFGNRYRNYQKIVPMIIPYRIPRSTDQF